MGCAEPSTGECDKRLADIVARKGLTGPDRYQRMKGFCRYMQTADMPLIGMLNLPCVRNEAGSPRNGRFRKSLIAITEEFEE